MTRFALLVLTVAAVVTALVTGGMISYNNPVVAGAAARYGEVVSRLVEPEVVYNGALRAGILTPRQRTLLAQGQWEGVAWQDLNRTRNKSETVRVAAVTPDARDYAQVVKNCLKAKVKVVVESSGMDAWHSTEKGLLGLQALFPQALRVVIFDGGHHLPTLGLHPDLIIVPVTTGYAAHGYTRDAVELKQLLAIMRREKIGCPVVTVPRWALVKTEGSMNMTAVKAISEFAMTGSPSPPKTVIIGPRTTLCGNAAFMYVHRLEDEVPDWVQSKTGVGVKRAYIAFNFSAVGVAEAREYARRFEATGIEVHVVNEPVHVAAALWRGGLRCILALKPWS